MKLNKTELEFIWIALFCSVTFFGRLLERLREIKSNEKDDVFIFGVVIILLYTLICTIFLFFCMSNKNTNADIYLLWLVFIITMSFGSLMVVATEERLETFHYLWCSLIQLYALYIYELYFSVNNDIHGRTYVKRLLIRIKRLGRRKF